MKCIYGYFSIHNLIISQFNYMLLASGDTIPNSLRTNGRGFRTQKGTENTEFTAIGRKSRHSNIK